MSQQKIPLLTLATAAAAAIDAGQFVTTTGTIPAAGAAANGIAAAPAAPGETFPYDVIGTSIAIAGEDIDVGADLQVGDAGTAVPQTTGVRVAHALQSAVTGERFEVLLIQGGAAPTPAGDSGSGSGD